MNDASWLQKPLRAKSISDVLTPEQCETVRCDALAVGLLKKGASDAAGRERSKKRTSDSASLPRTPQREWLYELILSKTAVINEETWRFALSGIEDIRILRYGPFRRAKWHFDVFVGSSRKLICIVNLSSPSSYWRGGLEVKGPHENKALAGLQGAGTWFPAYIEHRATPPWRGERWSLAAVLTGPEWV